jgi:tRNA U54 and U55 pseudouridine synthase Pus10
MIVRVTILAASKVHAAAREELDSRIRSTGRDMLKGTKSVNERGTGHDPPYEIVTSPASVKCPGVKADPSRH